MAKQLHVMKYMVEVTYVGGVQDSVKLSNLHYEMCESGDSSLRAHDGLHAEDNVPRTLGTTSGLEDTVQTLTDDLEAEVKTKEGI
ncbi:MAG: hypothetical protein ACXABY_10235 [Candidatus Thorarchaeota archaeon]|jgi:hypothetical protein